MPELSHSYYDLEEDSDFARWLSECACPICLTEHEVPNEMCDEAA
jgi:hypothetical protein